LIVVCEKCGRGYDDEYRWTICQVWPASLFPLRGDITAPHETFAANDGKNNLQPEKQ
jgi:hypothetical protein